MAAVPAARDPPQPRPVRPRVVQHVGVVGRPPSDVLVDRVGLVVVRRGDLPAVPREDAWVAHPARPATKGEGVTRRADRVVAVAPFFNERDVLRVRLEELAGVVDCHVFCEAAWTYAGNAKALRCVEWALEVAPADADGVDVDVDASWGEGVTVTSWSSDVGEVRVVELADAPPADFQDVYQGFGERERWRRENWQRSMLEAGLPAWLRGSDVVALSDVDEVPSRLLLEWYVTGGLSALVQPAIPLHVGALNWRWREPVPVILRCCRADRLAGVGGLEGLRRSACAVLEPRQQWSSTRPGEAYGGDLMSAFGWHLSYLGGAEAIRYKVREAAHPELERAEFVGPGVVEQRLADGCDLFGRGGWRDAEWVGVEHAAWPGVVLDDPAAWRHLMVAAPGAPDKLW